MISRYLLNRFISPAVFLDVRLYVNGRQLETDINWDDMKLHAFNPTDKLVSTIAIYVDLDYLNTARIESYGDTASKINPSLPDRVY